MTRSRVHTHPYHRDPDLAVDHRGHGYCATCGLPEDHASHTLPDTPPAASDRAAGPDQEDQ